MLDSAHNPDSFSKLDKTLEDYFPEKPVVMIFGISEDKNVAEMIAALAPRLEKVILTKSVHPRAVDAEKMVEFAEQAGVAYEAIEPVEAAVDRALEIAGEDTLILSAGSIFLTAAVREILSNK